MPHIRIRSNGTYQVRYRDPKKSERAKSFRKKVDAERFCVEVAHRLNNNSWVPDELARKPFKDFADLWLRSIETKPSTRITYISTLNRWVLPEFGQRPISRISWVDIDEFKTRLLNHGLSPKTVRNVLNVVSPIFGVAVREGAIQSNPCQSVKKPRDVRLREIQFPTPEQIREIAEMLGGQDRLHVLCAGYSGLRSGELAGLMVGDINFELGHLHVRRSVSEAGGHVQFVTPKTYRGRIVPIPSFLLEELRAYLTSRGVSEIRDAMVFPSPEGDVLRHSNFYRRRFKPVVKALGYEKIRFHDLRHAYASILINENFHARLIMERLGHQSISMTMNTYGHLFPGDSHRTSEALDRVFQQSDKH